jgi:hypothetical protein
MATINFTIGHILMGMIVVRAPVNTVSIAIAINTPAHAQKIILITGSPVPINTVTSSVSAPIKQSVNPSAIHSMMIIFLLSDEISPKFLTIDLMGIMWAMPHRKMIIAPVISRISSTIFITLASPVVILHEKP